MAQSQDERAARRLLKRAIRRKDWTLVAILMHELANVWLEEEGEECLENSGDRAVGYSIALRSQRNYYPAGIPVSRPNLKAVT